MALTKVILSCSTYEDSKVTASAPPVSSKARVSAKGIVTMGGIQVNPPVVTTKGGNYIVSMDQVVTSFENGGVNVWRMTLSDGSQYDFEIRNGDVNQGVEQIEVVQETGESTTKVMSQRAVTHTIDSTVGNINALLSTL